MCGSNFYETDVMYEAQKKDIKNSQFDCVFGITVQNFCNQHKKKKTKSIGTYFLEIYIYIYICIICTLGAQMGTHEVSLPTTVDKYIQITPIAYNS